MSVFRGSGHYWGFSVPYAKMAAPKPLFYFYAQTRLAKYVKNGTVSTHSSVDMTTIRTA